MWTDRVSDEQDWMNFAVRCSLFAVRIWSKYFLNLFFVLFYLQESWVVKKLSTCCVCVVPSLYFIFIFYFCCWLVARFHRWRSTWPKRAVYSGNYWLETHRAHFLFWKYKTEMCQSLILFEMFRVANIDIPTNAWTHKREIKCVLIIIIIISQISIVRTKINDLLQSHSVTLTFRSLWSTY